jgi:ribA/ribD-fused uncharacterized protein
MKNLVRGSFALLSMVVLPGAVCAQAPAGRAARGDPLNGKPLQWDDSFDAVLHGTTKIAGFVAEYRWLSNFFPCRVEWKGRVYGSSEAAYHSGKYPETERDVFTRLDADRARKLSRAKPYDAGAWEARKVQTMREVVWAKFSQNPELGQKLLSTKDRHLEETNWWGDKIWGVYQGEGQNLLGIILMEVRARLAAENPSGEAR